MPRFARGVLKFQKEIFPGRKELFEKLSLGQSPEALFITCSDSRIETGMMTQTDPGWHEIVQAGRVAGVILVPDRDPAAREYEEYWFLFDEYVYPSERNPIATTIHPVRELDDELWQRVEAGEGRWVLVEATERR